MLQLCLLMHWLSCLDNCLISTYQMWVCGDVAADGYHCSSKSFLQCLSLFIEWRKGLWRHPESQIFQRLCRLLMEQTHQKSDWSWCVTHHSSHSGLSVEVSHRRGFLLLSWWTSVLHQERWRRKSTVQTGSPDYLLCLIETFAIRSKPVCLYVFFFFFLTSNPF